MLMHIAQTPEEKVGKKQKQKSKNNKRANTSLQLKP
jgi:hypothetical protein